MLSFQVWGGRIDVCVSGMDLEAGVKTLSPVLSHSIWKPALQL